MAATDITIVKPTTAGADPAFASADGTNGNAYLNSKGNVQLWVKNDSGGSINATIAIQQASRAGDAVFPPQTVSSIVVAVPAAGIRVIGPLPSCFNDGNQKVQVTFSSATSVKVAAIEQV